MGSMNLASLVGHRVLDADLAALLWLLTEGGVPLVMAGSADARERTAALTALLSVDPSRPWTVLDTDEGLPSVGGLESLMMGGIGLGLTLRAADLGRVLARLEATGGLPSDAVRRLGVVLLLDSTPVGQRLAVAHYLRPAERDGQGHVQRRPPAVLATWDEGSDGFEHYAWGITPELADRVDRSQADLEERQASRARFLREITLGATSGNAAASDWETMVSRHLDSEPPRVPAPTRAAATPSRFSGGLTDPDPDPHVH